MGWGAKGCEHDWRPTSNRDLEQCAHCETLRHRVFVGGTRTHTRTATKEALVNSGAWPPTSAGE